MIINQKTDIRKVNLWILMIKNIIIKNKVKVHQIINIKLKK